MHRRVSAPSGCDFIHRVLIEEVSGYQVLLKSGPGNRGLPNVAPPTRLRLEFPRETGLVLMCARKVGNVFQTKQGNRTSCRDQEGRRVSDEVVPGTSVFSSSENGMLGNFWGRIKGAKYCFALQDGTWDYS